MQFLHDAGLEPHPPRNTLHRDMSQIEICLPLMSPESATTTVCFLSWSSADMADFFSGGCDIITGYVSISQM